MYQKVLVLNTGGTIAMSVDESDAAVKLLDGQVLQKTLPELKRYADVTMKKFLQLPSPHMTPALMNRLRAAIERELAQFPWDGVVVTHGTDTLEETAYFLDLTLSLEAPVVLTGAMRSSSEPGADGLANLIASVRTAADTASRQRGVLVVFHDEIHSARHVTKIHTSSTAAFQSPGHGPVGIVSKQGLHYFHPPAKREHYPVASADANVPLIKAVAGMDPAWLAFLLEQPIDGLVIEGFGMGNLPPAILPTLEKLLQKGVPVVLVSRCCQGLVQDVYGYEGGGRHLKKMGVIFGGGLNGPKARLKLIAALEQTRDFQQLQAFFATA